MTDDNCDLCDRPFRKRDKVIEEMLIVEGTAVHFAFHEGCKKGLDWYDEMRGLAVKNRRREHRRPLKSQSVLKEVD